jgi:predicted phage gp36 major capsid-like protein
MGLGIKIAIGVIILSMLGGSWVYIKALKAELQVAAEVQGKMQGVIDGQKAVMERQAEDLKKQQEINNDVNKKFADSQKAVGELQKKFEKRNFDQLTKKKPDAVERLINRGTEYALRCNELVTGSPLTDEEKTGKVRNTICRDLIELLRKENEPAKK